MATEDNKAQTYTKDPPAKKPASKNNDFVIREGFPALRLANGDPWIEGDEPLPRSPFWAHEKALAVDGEVLEKLRVDCETVFSARAKEDDQAYSAGVTYFCPCQMKPRCALEALVLDIFRKHTEALDQTTFIPEQSGAEWWTLVLDEGETDPKANSGDNEDDEEEGDEVGMHFDADYGLEDQAPNLLLHPRLATVTYLSDCGAPTVVLNRRSPPPNDAEKKSLAGLVDKGWLSHPKVGKHIAFDGRLLHGAPATFFPGRSLWGQSVDGGNVNPPPNKKLKTEHHKTGKRYTLLVNLWLNHCPLDAEPLEEEVVEKLISPWKNGIEIAKDEKTSEEKSTQLPTWAEDFLPATRKSDEGTKVSLSVSMDDPAGEEEVVICSRRVTVHYGPTMDDLHKTSASSSLLDLDLARMLCL